MLVPYFAGERTPNLPEAKAELVGMTLANTTPANLARAAFEGVLCGLADGLDALVANGVEVRRVLLLGGADPGWLAALTSPCPGTPQPAVRDRYRQAADRVAEAVR